MDGHLADEYQTGEQASDRGSCVLLEVPAPSWAPARLSPDPFPTETDSSASRFGQAVHRLVECAAHADDVPQGVLLRRVARDFQLDASTLDDAVAMARRILQGQGRWAWDPQVIEWAGNEVELLWQGRLLRLDRLVRRRDDASWWVLDFKSASRPEQDAALRAQLAVYMDAVRALHPGDVVRAAFLTGEGRVSLLPD